MSLQSLPSNTNEQSIGSLTSQPEDNFWKSKPYERYYNRINMDHDLGYINQLIQLLRIVHDGDLISKSHRDALYKEELIVRCEGWQIISSKGVKYLNDLGIIKP